LGKFRPDLLSPEGSPPSVLPKWGEDATGGVLGEIAEELGKLPLALHLAGSFLARYENVVRPKVYLDQLRDKALLDHPSLRGRGAGYSSTDHELHVGRTFLLSYARLKDEDTDDPSTSSGRDVVAKALLARAACFAPGEPIPRELLVATLGLADEADAPLQAEDGLIRLVELGLLEQQEDGALVLHRLLAEFVQKVSVETGAQTAVEKAILAEIRRLNDAAYPEPQLALQPHILAVTDAAKVRYDEIAGVLCNEFGYLLDTIGDYTKALPYYERATIISEKSLGIEHPNTIKAVSNLGLLHKELGNNEAAKKYLEQALEIWQILPGEPDLKFKAVILNNLGLVLTFQRDFDKAHTDLKEALVIRRRVLGEGHEYTAQSLNNMGFFYLEVGSYDRAQAYLEKALVIRKKVLGEVHPDVAVTLTNLGDVRFKLGDHAGAQFFYEQARDIWQQLPGGKTHPRLAFALNGLAGALRSQGDFVGAKDSYEEALSILEARLGRNHLSPQDVRRNLATLNEELNG
jgi:tetratricopeptide (TPR) repeat protein